MHGSSELKGRLATIRIKSNNPFFTDELTGLTGINRLVQSRTLRGSKKFRSMAL